MMILMNVTSSNEEQPVQVSVMIWWEEDLGGRIRTRGVCCVISRLQPRTYGRLQKLWSPEKAVTGIRSHDYWNMEHTNMRDWKYISSGNTAREMFFKINRHCNNFIWTHHCLWHNWTLWKQQFDIWHRVSSKSNASPQRVNELFLSIYSEL